MDQETRSGRNILLVLSALMLGVLCILALAAAGMAGYYVHELQSAGNAPLAAATVPPSASTATRPLPTAPPAGGTLPPIAQQEDSSAAPTLPATAEPVPTATAVGIAQVPAAIDRTPVDAQRLTDLERLLNADYPYHDYFEAARTLGRNDLGDRNFKRPALAEGTRRVFYTDEGSIEATLVAVTEHAYFWVEEGLTLDEAAVRQSAAALEEAYYPLLSHLFDQPWLPGVDGDPHFSVLHLIGSTDSQELGYFTDQDEYPRALFADSNEQELIYLNMAQLELGSPLYFGTLVHELQHLTQWNLDKNEETWLNEGLSQLAELYVGLDTVLADSYLAQPDVRLNSWDYDEDVVDAHYGASYLYLVYLWEQLSENAVYELTRHPHNGLAAVAAVLRGYRPDADLTAFTADWAVANYLDDPAAGERYYYQRLELPEAYRQTRIRNLPYAELLTLDQFGVHYIELDTGGPVTIAFAGDTHAPLIDAPLLDSDSLWISPAANNTSATLTGSFDLSNVAQASLQFRAWYELEEDYDFAYISISDDSGDTWSLLQPQHAHAGDYGPALTGASAGEFSAQSGWVTESIRLDDWAGRPVLLRFHVLTDFENPGGGFALDDIAIPEIGYASSADETLERWQPAGFVRTGGQLPQQWAVRLIRHGTVPEVVSLGLDERNQVQQTVTLGPAGGTLVVLPATPFVDDPADYWLQITN